MPIKLMKIVDVFIGVPLCLLLSVVHFFQQFLKSSHDVSKQPQRILFIKISEMGGILQAFPLMTKIKKIYPEAELYFLTFDKNVSIFKFLEGIVPDENILTMREGTLKGFLEDGWATFSRFQELNFDIVFDLEFFARSTAILSFLTGANKKVGFDPFHFEGLYRGSFLTHKIVANPLTHVSRLYLSMADSIEKDKKTAITSERNISSEEIVIPQAEIKKEDLNSVWKKLDEKGASQLNRLYLMNPGEGVIAIREWPLKNFIELGKKILADEKAVIVLIGTDGAQRKGEQMQKELGERCVSMISETTLDEFMALCSISHALIANDCGSGHLASLTKIPQYIFFGPETHEVFGPIGEQVHVFNEHYPCSPCLSALNHRTSSCRDNRCLQIIEPTRVYEVVRKLNAETVTYDVS